MRKFYIMTFQIEMQLQKEMSEIPRTLCKRALAYELLNNFTNFSRYYNKVVLLLFEC